MPDRRRKGRFISDKLKAWHIALLAALVIGLFSVQWWLNERAAIQEHPEGVEHQND